MRLHYGQAFTMESRSDVVELGGARLRTLGSGTDTVAQDDVLDESPARGVRFGPSWLSVRPAGIRVRHYSGRYNPDPVPVA